MAESEYLNFGQESLSEDNYADFEDYDFLNQEVNEEVKKGENSFDFSSKVLKNGSKGIVDPASGKPVVFIYGEWKTVAENSDGTKSYGDVSEDFNNKSLRTLEELQKSKVGRELIAKMQAHTSKITIDETDEEELLKETSTSSNAVHKGKGLTDEGLYTEVTVVPNIDEILKNTKENGGSFEERLLGTMFVEFSHFETADQIDWEHSVSTYKNPRRFAQTYNGLMNNAISAMIDYRNEKDIPIDKSVFTIYEKFKETINNEGKVIGGKIELNSENQKIYDEFK